jgi:hypothetical protein
VVLVTEVFYFYMKSEGGKLSQGRLGSLIFLFRVVGIPYKMKKISTIYAIYMITFFTSVRTTYLGICVHVYIHRVDLGLAIKTINVLFKYSSIMWTFLYCR